LLLQSKTNASPYQFLVFTDLYQQFVDLHLPSRMVYLA
jgi:hypothetical protein